MIKIDVTALSAGEPQKERQEEKEWGTHPDSTKTQWRIVGYITARQTLEDGRADYCTDGTLDFKVPARKSESCTRKLGTRNLSAERDRPWLGNLNGNSKPFKTWSPTLGWTRELEPADWNSDSGIWSERVLTLPHVRANVFYSWRE